MCITYKLNGLSLSASKQTAVITKHTHNRGTILLFHLRPLYMIQV